MITIERIIQQDCTIGVLNYLDFRCFTIEPPWKFNKANESCIPKGFYIARKHISPTFGNCLLVEGVPNRTWILIHAGNYVDDTQGCILPGQYIKDINADGIPDVANSQATLDKLLSLLKFESMGLKIT